MLNILFDDGSTSGNYRRLHGPMTRADDTGRLRSVIRWLTG
jgi:hypothetical protein